MISEITIISRVVANPDTNSPVRARGATQATGSTFQINNAKHYVPVVTLSINDNIKF